MKCGLCQRAVRKTTTVLVLESGRTQGKRVCAACEALGVLIVPGGAAKGTTCSCGELATSCAKCTKVELKHARDAFVRAIERATGVLKARQRVSPSSPALDGFEECLDIFKAEIKS